MPELTTKLSYNDIMYPIPTPLKMWGKDRDQEIGGNIWIMNYVVQVAGGEVTPEVELEMIEKLNEWAQNRKAYVMRMEPIRNYGNIEGMRAICFINKKLHEDYKAKNRASNG